MSQLVVANVDKLVTKGSRETLVASGTDQTTLPNLARP